MLKLNEMSLSYYTKREGFIWKISDMKGITCQRDFKNYGCSIRFSQFYMHCDRDNEYTILMENRKTPPFSSVSVHVEDTNRNLLPLSSICSDFSCNPVVVWRYSTAEILKCVPHFNDDHADFYFLITANFEKNMKYIFTSEPHLTRAALGFPKSNPACLRSLCSDIFKMLEKKAGGSDMVQITCGDRTMEVQRYLLCARSEVFSAMLRSGMMEDRTNTIKMQDLDPEVFGYFMRYLCTAELPEISFQTAKLLYEVADMYAIKALVHRCASILCRLIMNKGEYEMLILADAHGDKRFRECVIGSMIRKEFPCSLHPEWNHLLKKHPILALEVSNRHTTALFCANNIKQSLPH